MKTNTKNFEEIAGLFQTVTANTLRFIKRGNPFLHEKMLDAYISAIKDITIK